jgi:hypothetical protein
MLPHFIIGRMRLMKKAREFGRSALWYALPIAAIMAALRITRRFTRSAESNRTKEETLLAHSNLDLRSALNVALRYAPGTPVEVELEEEHGSPVWEVEIVPRKGGPTRAVVVDARTGDVLEMRADLEEELPRPMCAE